MDIFAILVTYMILLFSLCVHEFAHAWTANLCGDDTARLQGRMTLNPFAHIDPIGTVFIPLMQLMSPILIPIFGWAKPVPVNPRRFGNYRRDDMLVSLAGIIANFIVATVAVVLLRILLVLADGGMAVPVAVLQYLKLFFGINVMLGVFNLLPIPPLDGYQFGKHFLPMHIRWNEAKWFRYGPMLLIFLMFTGGLRMILTPVISLCYRIAFYGL